MNAHTTSRATYHMREGERMRAQVYKQAFDDPCLLLPEIEVADFSSPFADIDCLECDGTGTFVITEDDSFTCVVCRGTGKVNVSLY